MSKAILPHGMTQKQMDGQWVAIYARVSSEEQRENQTIQTQIDTAKRWVEFQRLVNKPLEIYDLYLDDGVSGTIPFAQRPAGKRLLQDATNEKFTMILGFFAQRPEYALHCIFGGICKNPQEGI